MIWQPLWHDMLIESQVQNFLGLPPLWIWTKLILFALMVAPFIGGAFIVNSWPGSTSPEEFEKRVVTLIGQRGKRVSFDVPNPFKSGKFLHVNFKAKTSAEADQIVEAVRISKVADGTDELSEATDLSRAELAETISVSPDAKREFLSGLPSEKEVMAKYGVPAKQLRDILSGQYSKKEIMIKYAMPPEEIEEICKRLAGKL